MASIAVKTSSGRTGLMSLRRKKTLKESASDFAESILPALETAVDTAKELAADARDKAAPALADARDKAGPALADARDRAVPVVAAGAAVAAEKAAAGTTLVAEKAAEGRDALAERTKDRAQGRQEGGEEGPQEGRREGRGARQSAEQGADFQRERAAVKIAAFQDASSGNKVTAFKDAEPKKGGKLKKLLLFGALAGIGALVFKKLKGDNEAAHWQKSYTPTPAPSTTPSTHRRLGGLSAAAGDAVGSRAGARRSRRTTWVPPHRTRRSPTPPTQPHPDTTPDDPLEVVEIDSENKS